jgi:hypothetical protein
MKDDNEMNTVGEFPGDDIGHDDMQQQQEEDDVEEEDDDSAIVTRICRDSMTYDVKYDYNTGRIIELALEKTLTPSAPYDHRWDLSPGIARLDALQSLSLTSCKLLPPEISQLQNLRRLTLIGCKRLEEFPPNLFGSVENEDEDDNGDNSLWRLEELRILGIIPMIPTYILSQIASLPNLKVLQFSFHGNDDEEQIRYLNQLVQPIIQFKNSLEELLLNRCHITTKGFNLLISQVIQQYPNLKSLSLCKNQIQTFREVTMVDDNNNVDLQCQLHELILSDNPIWSKESSPSNSLSYTSTSSSSENTVSKTEPERHFLQHFLQYQAVRLGYLGYRFEKSSLWSPNIQHLLDINRCGRCLIDHGSRGMKPSSNNETNVSMDVDRNDHNNTTTAQEDDRIPLALWALILGRVNNILPKLEPIVRNDVTIPSSTRTANAMYYFVRNSPAVAGRNLSSS